MTPTTTTKSQRRPTDASVDNGVDSDTAETAAHCGSAPRKKRRTATTPAKEDPSLELGPKVTVLRLRAQTGSPVRVVDDGDGEDSNLLEQLLDGSMQSETFLNTCFRRRAVHVACPNSTKSNPKIEKYHRLHELSENTMYGLDPEDILQETASDSVFVWLMQHQINNNNCSSSSSNETSHIHSIEINDANTAYHLYKAGHSTYCRANPALERALVRGMLRATGLGCGQYSSDPTKAEFAMGRGEVETFLSSRAGHVTDWHYDFQENFTLQLSGVKRWSLQSNSTVRHPLRACTPHYRNTPADVIELQVLAGRLTDPNFQFSRDEVGASRPAATETTTVETVDLNPGDILYFPAGMWHKVEVIEPGVSINVSLMAATYANITCQALQHVLLQKSEWRECVHNNPAVSRDGRRDVVQRLKSLLKALPGIIQDFEHNGGAESILPPVLRLPQMGVSMAESVKKKMLKARTTRGVELSILKGSNLLAVSSKI
jgi:Cupin-like domain